LTVKNSPNFEQSIRLLQKSQVSQARKVLNFQNLTKPRYLRAFCNNFPYKYRFLWCPAMGTGCKSVRYSHDRQRWRNRQQYSFRLARSRWSRDFIHMWKNLWLLKRWNLSEKRNSNCLSLSVFIALLR